MALFPQNPANNQQMTVNGITYVYNSSLTAWVRYATFLGNVTANNGTFYDNVTVTNNFTAGNVSATGNITGQYILGNGAFLTGIQTGAASNISNGTSNVSISTSGGNVTTSVGGNANVLVVTGTGINVAGTLNATGNANVGNIGATNGALTGNLSLGGGTGGSLTGANLVSANYITGTLTTESQPNITSIGTLSSLSVTGKVTAGQLQGDGGNLSNIQGANVSGTVANATYAISAGSAATATSATTAGTVTTASQPNITSVGALSSLNVNGDTVVNGNLAVNGNLTYLNVETVAVEDPIIELQTGPNGAAPTSNSGKDVGTSLNYYDTAARQAFMGWQNSTGKMIMASNVTVTGDVVTVNNYGNAVVGGLEATSVSATGNITGQYILGNGALLTGIATGTASNLANGNSNITISNNSNITFAVRGQPSTLILSNTGIYSNANGFVLKNPIVETGGNPNTAPLTSNDGKDRGLLLNYYNTFPAKAFMGWQNANSEFVFASEVSNVVNDVVTVFALGNIRANWIYGNFNGNITGNITVTGPDTAILFNDGGVGATANGITFNKTTNALSASNTFTASSTITGGNLVSNGTLSVVGNANVSGILSATGRITSSGQIRGANLYSSDFITAVGDISGNNFSATGGISALGDLNSNNLITTNKITALGDIDISGNSKFGQNGNNFDVSANYANFNVKALTVGSTSAGVYLYPNGTAVISSTGTASLSVAGNIQASNVRTTTLSVTGNANLSTLNLTGNISTASNLAVTGNITANNANITNTLNANLVSANFLAGDGYLISNLTIGAGSQIINGNSNVTVAPNANVTISANGQQDVVVITGANAIFSTNVAISSGNLLVSGTVNAQSISNGTSNIRIATNGNIGLSAGNISNVATVSSSGLSITGNLQVSNGATITGQLSATGNVVSANLSTVNITATGNATANNANITNTLNANLVSANFLSGDGYLISNITVAAGSQIINGNSSVSVTPNSNVQFAVNGTSNVFSVGETLSTFASNLQTSNLSVTGTANIATIQSVTINSTSVTGTNLYANASNGSGGSLTVAKDASVGGNLSVTAQANFNSLKTEGALSSNGTATFNGNATFQKPAIFNNAVTFSNTANFTGNISATVISASGNVTGATVNANLVSANFLSGDGYLISNLTVPAGTYILNGTSNVVVNPSGNVTTSVGGNANVLVVTGTGANVSGTFRSTGNANVGNIGAAAGVFTSAVSATNANFTGDLSVTGNATTGNITAPNANLGNLVTANYFSGDGYLLSNLTIPAGTEIVNGNSNVYVEYSGNINFKANGAVNMMSVTKNGVLVNSWINAASYANGTSNIVIQNNGNVVIGVAGTGNVVTVTSTGANIGGTLATTGDLSVAGNITTVGLNATTISATGNIVGGSLRTTGVISASGNANIGNLGITGLITAVGNVRGGNLTTGGLISATGNVSGGNLVSAADISAVGNVTGQYYFGNGSQLTGITAVTAQTVTNNAQPNITSVGTLTSLSVSGNSTFSNVSGTDASFSGNAVVNGNLYVNGNLTYLNVDTMAIKDPIIQLQTGANGAAPTSNSGKDVGTALNYYDTAARQSFVGYKVSTGKMLLATNVSITGEVVTVNGYGNTVVGGLEAASISATGNISANNITATGDVTAQNVNSLSDAALKININPITDPQTIINKLFGVEYDWKNGQGHSYGLLAQDVEKVLPSAVKTNETGLKTVNYLMLIPFLIETIKQLGAEVAELKKKKKSK